MKNTKMTMSISWSKFYNFFCFIILYAIIALIYIGCGDNTDIVTETDTIAETEKSGIAGSISPAGIPANIILMQNGVLENSTDADQNGNYVFPNLAEGSYELVIKADGYEDYSRSVEVKKGQFTDLGTVTLKEVEKQPEPVTSIDTPEGLNIGNIAPDFTLPKLDGSEMSLYSNRGKVVLIDFWAGWCGPCRSTVPYLQRFYDKYKSSVFVVVGVNVGENKDIVKKFRDNYGLTYEILLGTNTGVDILYSIEWIPYICLLDRNGIIVWTQIGFCPGDEVELEKQILAVL